MKFDDLYGREQRTLTNIACPARSRRNFDIVLCNYRGDFLGLLGKVSCCFSFQKAGNGVSEEARTSQSS